MRILFKTDVSGTGGVPTTLNIDANGAKRVFRNDGVIDPTTAQLAAGNQLFMVYSGALNGGAGGWRIMSQ